MRLGHYMTRSSPIRRASRSTRRGRRRAASIPSIARTISFPGVGRDVRTAASSLRIDTIKDFERRYRSTSCARFRILSIGYMGSPFEVYIRFGRGRHSEHAAAPLICRRGRPSGVTGARWRTRRWTASTRPAPSSTSSRHGARRFRDAPIVEQPCSVVLISRRPWPKARLEYRRGITTTRSSFCATQ
jgi:hypothetical protein